MRVKIHLGAILADREMQLQELSQLVDISMANLSILKNGKAKAIRFSTLIKLCHALRCQPGDLITIEEPRQK